MSLSKKSPKFEQTEKVEEKELGKEFERPFLRDFPHFTAYRKDVRALASIRERLGLDQYEDLNIFVLADKKNKDISADRVFAEDEENNVVFYGTSGSVKRALEARGHEAKKKDLAQHTEDERANIFIMLDPKTPITKQLRANIAPRGLVFCRLSTANSLRAHGYTFRAIVGVDGSGPTFSRSEDPAFWKSVETDSEEAFRSAASSELEGVVSYTEAREKVREAKKAGVSGMSEDNVLESYKKLIDLAEKQNQNKEKKAILSYTVPAKKGEEDSSVVKVVFGINTVLPTKKEDDTGDIVVMKKGLT